MQSLLKTTAYIINFILLFEAAVLPFSYQIAEAQVAFNRQINYQGKLTDTVGGVVADGNYNLRFKLYTASSGGSPVWTETWCYSPDSGTTCNGTGTNNRPALVNGLFSVMLGSTTALTSVNFNQALYLGVEVGGTGSTPSWDGEMSPRKRLGTVPAAFEADNAQTVGDIASSSFLRSDTSDAYTSGTLTFNSGTSLTVNGNATFARATTTNATTTHLYIGTDLWLNGERFSDFTGTGLSVSSGTLNVTVSGTMLDSVFSSNGMLARTSAGTYASRTITGTTNRLTVTNGDGVSGNPTLDIAATYAGQTSITTLGTIATGVWNGTVIADSYINDALTISGGTINNSTIGASTPSTGVFTHATTTSLGINSENFTDLTGTGLTISGGALQTTLGTSVDLTTEVTGTLPVANGGTGATTLTGVLKGNGTSAITAMTGTANYVTRWTDANTLGTGVLYDNGTNVGVGTTTPTDKFFVYGGDVNVGKSSSTSFTGLRIHTAGTERAQVLGNLDSTDGGKLVFYTKASSGSLTEAARFDNAGRMSIGVGATPSGRLHVAGSGNVLFMNSGNTGVGTTSPYAKLSVVGHIVGAYYTATTTATSTLPRTNITRLTLGGDYVTDITGTGLSVSSGSLNVSAVPASALTLTQGYTYVGNSSNVASATSTLFISSAGNVGIGDTTPDTKLDVEGSSSTGLVYAANSQTWTGAEYDFYGPRFSLFGDIRLANSGVRSIYNVVNAGQLDISTNDGIITFTNGSSGVSERMRITTAGLVGIGTTDPQRKFEVSDSSNVYASVYKNAATPSALLLGAEGSINAIYSWTSPTSGTGRPLTFFTGASEVVRIDTTGFVGIGTTSPYAKLSVVGHIVGAYYTATTTSTSTLPRTNITRLTLGSDYLTDITGTGLSVSSGSLNVSAVPASALTLTQGYTYVGNSSNVASATSTLFISSAGNVGIGTTAPNENLSVVRSNEGNIAGFGANGVQDLFTINYTSGITSLTGSTYGSTKLASQNNQHILVMPNGTGNVGINNTSPSYKLDVTGFINTDQYSGYKQAGNTVLYASTTNNTLAVGSSLASLWMRATSSQRYSVAVGTGALATAPTTGTAQHNTALGYQSLYGNTAGAGNTGLGYATLFSNTTGGYNTASGMQSLYYNTTGTTNTALGYQSLLYNTTGSNNTAIGTFALYANTVGTHNTATGYAALLANTTGTYNTASGLSSLNSNTTGARNTASGVNSLYYNLSATSSTAIGYAAAQGSANYSNQGGTYVGYASGFTAGTGSDYNTLIGFQTGYGITTGARNTVLGNSTIAASYNQITTGSNNIAIGNDVAVPSATASNQLVIGNLIYGTGLSGTGSTVSSSGKIGIGTTTPQYPFHVSGGAPRITVTGTTDGSNVGYRLEAESANATRRNAGYYLVPGNTTATTYLGLSADDSTYAMVATAAGNVGIGTTGPSSKLHVTSSETYDGITISGTIVPRVVFNSANASSLYWGIGTHDNDANNFAIGSNASGHGSMTEYFLIDSDNGYIGIGTTSPYAKLSVAGHIVGAYYTATTTSTSTLPRTNITRLTLGGDYVTDITGTGLSVSSGSLNVSAVPASALTLTQGYTYVGNSSNVASATSTLFISSASRVGIKQTSPGTTLDVGASTLDTIRSYGGFTGHASANIDGTGAAAYFPNGLYSSAGTSWIYGNVYFSAGASVIQSDGDVGIGTTNPSGRFGIVSADTPYMFTVAGTTKGVRFEGNSTGVIITGVDNTLASSYEPLYLNGSYLAFQNSTTEVMRITGTKVGVGTTNPNFKLTVSAGDQDGISVISSGTARLEFNPDGGGAVVLNNADANGFFFNQNSSTKVTFDGSGNVGIGDTSPDAKLDVDTGDVLVDGGNTHGVGNIYLKNSNNFGGNDVRNQRQISVANGLNGRIANRNTDMLDGTTGYNGYDNSGGGKTTLSAVASTTAPNSSGKIMRITYDGTGTPNSNPTPGYGGFSLSLPECTGTNNGVNGYCYRQGGRYHIRIWAAIPSGRTMDFATNSYGTGGTYIWLTPRTGTGTVQLYEAVQTIGIGGSLSNTGYWYIADGTNAAFSWDVARVEMVAIDEGASVQMATNLNVGYYQGQNLAYGELISTANSYLAVSSGSVGVKTTTLDSSASLTVAGSEAGAGGIAFWADEGDDDADKWLTYAGVDGKFYILDKSTGSYVSNITIDGATGNMGIGTATPGSRLSVSGGSLSATSDTTLNFASGLTTGRAGTYDANSLSAIHTYYDASSVELSAGSTNGYVSAMSVTGIGGTNYDGTVRLITASTERMRIDSAGDVGIGSTSPYAKLSVTNTGSTPSFIVEDATSPDTTPFVIDASGQVGVGISAPVARLNPADLNTALPTTGVWQQLEVTGVTGTQRLSLGVLTSAVGSAGAGTGVIQALVNGSAYTNLALNPSGGNVGIATAAPTSILQIGTSAVAFPANTGLGINGTYALRFAHTDGNADYGGYAKYGYSSGTLLTLGTRDAGSDQDALTVKLGNVGIGTTNPSTKLHINAEIIDDAARSYDTNALMVVHQTPTATATLNDPEEVLYLGRQGTGGQAYGALATFKLSRYENSSTNSRTRLDLDLTHGAFTDATVMTFLSSGNVGIGTTSPYAKLSIAGETVSQYFTATTSSGTSTFPNLYTTQLRLGSDYVGDITGSGLSISNGALTLSGVSPSALSLTQGYTYVGNGSNVAEATSTLFIASSGKIGIGNNAPTYTFDVTGTGRFTDDLYMESGLQRLNNSLDDLDGALYMQYYSASGGVVIGDSGVDHDLTVYGTGTFNENILLPTLAIRSDNSGTADRPYFRGTATHLVIAPASNLTGGVDANTMYLSYPGDLTSGDTVTTRIQESLYITATGSSGGGSVGIGEGNPGSKLSVSGNATIGASYDTTAAPTNGLIVEGNVGIGTASPQEKLQIVKDATPAEGSFGLSILSAAADSELALGASASGDYSYIQSFSDGTLWTNRPLILQPNGGGAVVGTGVTLRSNVTLDVAGGIGMGRLGMFGTYNSSQIQGIWSISPDYLISTGSNNAGNAYGMVYNYDSNGVGISGFSHQITFVGNGTRYASISMDTGKAYFAGSVGIGTTAPTTSFGRALHIQGPADNAAVRLSGTTGSADLQYDGGNLYSDLSTASAFIWRSGAAAAYTERMKISTTGNVGIGSSNPSTFKLQVAGSVGPETDATYDLGSAAKQWNNLYVKNAPVVGGYTNLTNDNLLTNGDFETGTFTGWSYSSGSTAIVSTSAYAGNYSAQSTGYQQILSDDYIPVDPDYDVFQLEGYFKETTTGSPTPGTLYFGYIAYDENKTAITTSPCGSYCYFAAAGYNVANDSAWHKFSATTNGEGTSFPNFPVGTKFVRVLMLMNYAASSNEVTRFDHITLKRINHGPLFVGNNFSTANLLNQQQTTQLYTTASNDFIITPPSSRYVGIGTASPSARLHVNNSSGTVGLFVAGNNSWVGFSDNSNYLGGGTYFRTAAGGAGNAYIDGTSGNSYFSAVGGNVGIGTAAPGAKLGVVTADAGTIVVSTPTNAGGDTTGIEFNYGGVTGGNTGNIARIMGYVQAGGGGDLLFQTAGTASAAYASKMVILRGGNVGIGSTNPGNLLTVNQAGNATVGTATTYGIALYNQGTVNATLGSDASSVFLQSWASKPLHINNQGNNTILNYGSGSVGIGEGSPGSKLSVSGNATIGASYDTTAAPTNGLIVEGNVGIANSSPSYTLDVAGTTRTGALRFIGEGGNSGNGNCYYCIYQETGAWTSPYPDLRIQFHTGIDMEAYYGYGGIKFYSGYDGTGDPAGLAFAVGPGDQTVRSYQNFYAPAFYDQDNAGYYLDPSATGTSINTAGDVSVGNQLILPVANTVDNNSPSITPYATDDFLYDSDYLSHYGFGFHTYGGGGNTYMSGYNGLDFFTGGTNRLHITSGGLVGLGDTTPETKLEISDGAITMNRDNVVHYKNVAHYRVNSDSQAGTMQIVMPKTWSDTMVQVTIKGYEYDSAMGAWEVTVSGYNYAASTQWIYTSADIKGNPPFSTVRLAHNGSANVILLGTTSTDWDYPQVAITDVITGYSNTTGWGTGWSVSLLSSEASITGINTPALDTQLADGTAAAPALNFISDTNTGFFRPTTDVLGFSTGGSERLRIDASGRVGISYANPLTNLFVYGTGNTPSLSASNGIVAIHASPSQGLEIGGDSGTAYAMWFQGKRTVGNDGTTWPLSFNPLGGNVGVGTTNPASKLHVSAGNIQIDQSQFLYLNGGIPVDSNWSIGKDSSHNINIRGGSSGTRAFQVLDATGGDAVRFHIDFGTANSYLNGGNFGIGTASPSKNLHVYGDAGGATSIMVDHGDSGADYTDADIQLVSRDSSNYRGLGMFMHNTNAQTEWFAGIPYANTDRYMIGRQASVATHDGSTAQTTNAFMVILNSGIAGIGTAAPDQGKLEVKGGSVCVDTDSNDSATSCIANESDIRLKKNIETLSASSSLATLLALNPVSFDWRVDDPEVISHYPLITRFASSTHSVGLIAQEVLEAYPLAMGTETVGDDEVQYYQLEYEKFIPLIISGVKELAIRVNTFGDTIVTLSERVDELATVVTALSERIGEGMVATGSVIHSGLSQFSALWVGEIVVGSSEKPTGITLYDEVTGEPYCFKVREGQVATTLGVCSTVPTDEAMDTDADSEAPILIITGNNPAIIAVGETYNDLGVTVTDNVNPNVGYKVLVDGVEVSSIMLDTSTERTYQIEYVAEDQAGNVGTTTRVVTVGTVEELPVVVEEDPPTTATTTPPTGE